MTEAIATAPASNGGIIATMAHRYGLEQSRFLATIKATVFPQGREGKEVSLEQTVAFLVVANQYNLNPFTKEIFAFPGRNGGIVPVVSVDGWATLLNRQENLDGIQFEDHLDEKNHLGAITCRIYRKDRSHPTEVTEYMDECKRNTDTWTKWPSRMLRHKALIQAARYAFGLVGIYDPDEAERIIEPRVEPVHKPEMPRRRSETVAHAQVEPQVVDAEVVEPQKPEVNEAAESKRIRKAIRDKFSEEQIEKQTVGRDIAALNLNELVALQEALEQSA